MFNPFPIVIADYRRNKVLTIITITLVAIALAMGIAVIAQERAIREGSAHAADDFDLVVGAPASPTQLILTSVYLKAQAIPLLEGKFLAEATQAQGVRYAAPIAFGDRYLSYPVVGSIAEFATRDGKLPFLEGRVMQKRGEALIGAKVDLPLGHQFSPSHGAHQSAEDEGEHEEEGEEHTGEEGDHHTKMRYTVVGKLSPRNNIWDKAIIVPVEDVWAVHDLPTGHEDDSHIGAPWLASKLPGIPALAIKPDSVSAAYALRGKFRTVESMAIFPAEVLNELYSTLGNIRDLMSLLTITTQVLVIIAVLMALLAGFLARRRQFAMLRAIGASRSYVFFVIWCEVSILIALGAFIGTFLGLGASHVLAYFNEQQLGFSMPVRLGMAEINIITALVFSGFIIALIPAALRGGNSIAKDLQS